MHLHRFFISNLVNLMLRNDVTVWFKVQTTHDHLTAMLQPNINQVEHFWYYCGCSALRSIMSAGCFGLLMLCMFGKQSQSIRST